LEVGWQWFQICSKLVGEGWRGFVGFRCDMWKQAHSGSKLVCSGWKWVRGGFAVICGNGLAAVRSWFAVFRSGLVVVRSWFAVVGSGFTVIWKWVRSGSKLVLSSWKWVRGGSKLVRGGSKCTKLVGGGWPGFRCDMETGSQWFDLKENKFGLKVQVEGEFG